jgi:hypothetical protein
MFVASALASRRDAGAPRIQESTSSTAVSAPAAPADAPTPLSVAPATFSLTTNNGMLDLVTRPSAQIVDARPGSHWMSFSVARRKGSVHLTSQSTNVNMSHKVQRLAKLNKRARQFDQYFGATAHLNGDEPLPTLETPKLAQLEAGDASGGGALVSVKRTRKKK